MNTFLAHLKNDDRLPIWIGGVCLLLSVLLFIPIINTLTTTEASIPPITHHATAKALPNIASLHLFGLYDAKLENLPITRLQLSLQGTIVLLDAPQASYALISTPGKPAKVYKQGDPAPGGALIEKILKDRVILNDNGKLQVLLLPNPTLQGVTDVNN